MVIAIAALYFGFNYLKGIDFLSKSSKYYAVYDNVGGLTVSNPVSIKGFAVGRVSRIFFAPDDQDKVVVEMDIDRSVMLGDSTVALLKGDFLGNKSIDLLVGVVVRAKEPGDTLLSELDKGLTDILAESAQPVANSLEVTIKKINAILDNLSGSSGKVNDMLTNFEQTSLDIQILVKETRNNLNALTASSRSMMATISTTSDRMVPFMDDYSSLADSLKALEIQATFDKATETLETLNQAIKSFQGNQGTLGKLMNEDSLYVNLNETLFLLDELLYNFNNHPKQFLSPLGRNSKRIERERRKEAENAPKREEE